MADDKNIPATAGQAPPAQNSSPQTVELNAGKADGWERAGTIAMCVALGALAVVLLDIAFKGKLLAPLFALLPEPRMPATPEEDKTGDG